MANHKDNTLHGVGAVFAAILLWGILPLYWKQLHRIPADQILANRIIWSFVFVMIVLTFQGRLGRLLSHLKKKQSLVLMLSGFILSLNWFTYISAVNSDQLIEASLGYYINPLLTILLGRVILKEKLDHLQLLAVILAAVGVGIITLSYGRIPFIALILAFTFASYSLAKKSINEDVVMGLTIETLAVFPVAVIYLWILGSRNQLTYGILSWTEILLVLGMGVITAIPLLLFSFGAKRIPLTMVGFIQYLTPTITLLLGILIYHEPFTFIHVLTFGCIWVALLIYSISQLRYFSSYRRAIHSE